MNQCGDRLPTALSTDQQQRYIEIWAKAVDTQMHFNEMSVKSRQLGLTFVAAALGIAVVLISHGEDFAVAIPAQAPVVQIHVSVILVIGALIALFAVRTLDLRVYHKMLRGAVTFGEDFEQHYMKQIFDLDRGMTQAVSHFSRFEDARKEPDEATGKYKYVGAREVTAEAKISAFYNYAFCFLGGAALVVFLLTNVAVWTGSGSRGQSVPAMSPPTETSPQHDADR